MRCTQQRAAEHRECTVNSCSATLRPQEDAEDDMDEEEDGYDEEEDEDDNGPAEHQHARAPPAPQARQVLLITFCRSWLPLIEGDAISACA